MITEIRHTGIVVADLERALHFYRDLLGFRIQKQMEESGHYLSSVLGLADAKATTVKMSAPDGKLIELLYFHSPQAKASAPKGPNDVGITHLAFTVKDLDETYRKLKAEGIRFTTEPAKSPDGYASVTFCRDPDGCLLELVQVL